MPPTETRTTEKSGEFRSIFAEFFPRLRSYFRSCGFQAADAEDLSQSALWIVCQSREQFRGDGDFDAWVYTIARNVARDEWRRRGRGAAGAEPVEESLADHSPSAEVLASGRQELRQTVDALGRLPARMRECLLLYVDQGLSYEEISRRLSLAMPTVKVQIWNARRRLRELLS